MEMTGPSPEAYVDLIKVIINEQISEALKPYIGSMITEDTKLRVLNTAHGTIRELTGLRHRTDYTVEVEFLMSEVNVDVTFLRNMKSPAFSIDYAALERRIAGLSMSKVPELYGIPKPMYGMGKTNFQMAMIKNAIAEGKTVIIPDMEVPSDKWSKMLSSLGATPLLKENPIVAKVMS